MRMSRSGDSIRRVGNVTGPQRIVKETLKRARRVLKVPQKKGVSVVLCDLRTIKKLNKQYRGIARPTDVLSFSYKEYSGPVSQEYTVGEIFICIPVARKQAKQFNNTLEKEVSLLTVHGLLHILGYDHRTKKQSERMRRFENKILEDQISRSTHR